MDSIPLVKRSLGGSEISNTNVHHFIAFSRQTTQSNNCAPRLRAGLFATRLAFLAVPRQCHVLHFQAVPIPAVITSYNSSYHSVCGLVVV